MKAIRHYFKIDTVSFDEISINYYGFTIIKPAYMPINTSEPLRKQFAEGLKYNGDLYDLIGKSLAEQ